MMRMAFISVIVVVGLAVLLLLLLLFDQLMFGCIIVITLNGCRVGVLAIFATAQHEVGSMACVFE